MDHMFLDTPQDPATQIKERKDRSEKRKSEKSTTANFDRKRRSDKISKREKNDY